MTKPNLFSGMQPSAGSLHLGNYLGALVNWTKMQDDYNAFYCVVDLHAITVAQDPAELRKNTRVTAAQYLAAGIDHNKSALFVQSHVPAHAQLAWVLMTITGFGEAGRMTQFKDKSQKAGSDSTSVGLFTYPILQAADILLYQPKAVPVGEDQRQHIELTRDLAARFNSRFGETFEIPEVVILKETAKIYDLQNPEAKMSKSGDPKGLVNIMDDSDSIMKKIKSAVTDTDGVIKFDREAKPGVSNLLGIHSAISGESIDALVSHFDGKGYGDLKTEVGEVVLSVIEPIRTRANELLADPAELDRLLIKGANKAQELAEVTLATVYERVGFIAPAR
ncbi:MAG: tryptophan--tRNA ligase [Actinobacteria bacterium]|jgi:tryptophanyl-tRNA synthetase|uniref:tryptophan--tRNA ligase n=2 Tax=freshwater metagenome TaxID=449393 RepID=A0A6J6JDQ4_9ZZZZ|nr:tryptophan--tRNA ligase [Actinomycetota bacterium]MTA92250.1 tryptophan--tRNA ligase [Actinomycetota bacterium]